MANNISFGGGNGGGGSSTLSGLSDVTLTTPTNGQVLKYDGSKWVNGTGGGSSGHTYSTTEQEIGTWVDGSTLYEKTISLQNVTLTANTSTLVEITDYVPNIAYGISVEGFFTYNNNNMTLPYYNGQYNVYIGFVSNTKVGIYRTASTITVDELYFTIRYVKSTS